MQFHSFPFPSLLATILHRVTCINILLAKRERKGRRIKKHSQLEKSLSESSHSASGSLCSSIGINLVAQTVQHLPAMRETPVRSLAWEDPLEKEMATHSSTLAWKIPWTEEPCRLQSMGSQRVGHN